MKHHLMQNCKRSGGEGLKNVNFPQWKSVKPSPFVNSQGEEKWICRIFPVWPIQKNDSFCFNFLLAFECGIETDIDLLHTEKNKDRVGYFIISYFVFVGIYKTFVSSESQSHTSTKRHTDMDQL